MPSDSSAQMRPMLLLLFVSTINPVAAQSLPRYDVDSACRRVVPDRGGYDYPGKAENLRRARQACIDAEQQDYDILRLLWSRISPEGRSQCVEFGNRAGGRQYAVLRECAGIIHQRERMQQSRQFKY